MVSTEVDLRMGTGWALGLWQLSYVVFGEHSFTVFHWFGKHFSSFWFVPSGSLRVWFKGPKIIDEMVTRFFNGPFKFCPFQLGLPDMILDLNMFSEIETPIMGSRYLSGKILSYSHLSFMLTPVCISRSARNPFLWSMYTFWWGGGRHMVWFTGENVAQTYVSMW